MATFQGKRVSAQWELVLTWAQSEGVRFTLNSGQRTMSEQQVLYSKYLREGWPVAAKPNRRAPHIRPFNHALDVDSLDGGETRLERWVESKGVDWKNTVRGESWHGEVSVAGLWKLYRLAKKELGKWAGYTDSERRWIEEYDRLLRARKDKDRRRVLRRVMKGQRKRVYREAKKSGWNKYNRRRRYASLLVRSR